MLSSEDGLMHGLSLSVLNVYSQVAVKYLVPSCNRRKEGQCHLES
jgi:hypothetical protein